ncbi:MAG: OsmC family protein [Bacteroidota bacterium]
MSYQVSTKWVEGENFDSYIDNHVVKIDTSKERTYGPGPKKLLLTSITGCSATDVVNILQKMRVPFEGLEVEGSAELTDGVPQVFKNIHMNFKIYGKDIKPEKVEKAIKMSIEQYCGVSFMLSKHNPVTSSFEIIATQEAI